MQRTDSGVSPEVHDHLHSFERVKLQVVKTAPHRLHLNSQLLESVSRLFIILDEADQCGVVSTRTGIENRWCTGRRAVCKVGEVLMVVWRCPAVQCGVFFQTCNRTHSNRLPVVDSPQCWGTVSYSWLSLSDLSTLMRSQSRRS